MAEMVLDVILAPGHLKYADDLSTIENFSPPCQRAVDKLIGLIVD